jgi:hypothetical protein
LPEDASATVDGSVSLVQTQNQVHSKSSLPSVRDFRPHDR